jgi:hypothetical protein
VWIIDSQEVSTTFHCISISGLESKSLSQNPRWALSPGNMFSKATYQ